ncbi:RluA family pseudouridine synthase [Patescibacteria group bacterium]|nr:RluA family pseudouridine synthase [Patescibacteria group bacterium]
MEQKIIVPSSDIGQRLDKFILAKFPRHSRAYLKEQIKLGNFLVYPVKSHKAGTAKQLFNRVNDKKVKPSYILRADDTVTLAPGFVLPESTAILPNPNIKLNILYEDADVLVINKPAGLSVHPRQDKNGLPLLSEVDSTLVSGLLAYYPLIANVGDHPLLRPGLVHRLDKDTSGVMIIAKNQTSFNWLKAQFKERGVTKKYIALVHGSLKEKQGTIKTLLARAIKNPTKQHVVFFKSPSPQTRGGLGWGDEKNKNTTPSFSPPQLRGRGGPREAITQYKVIREFKNYTLLEASPKTGRLHQIRVHLAHIGHPVVGDAKYGQRLKSDFKGRAKSDFSELLNRQFLHAQELKIMLPDGQKKTFSAPLPTNLNAVLRALENI